MKCSRYITIAESFFAVEGIFINTWAGLGGRYLFAVIGFMRAGDDALYQTFRIL